MDITITPESEWLSSNRMSGSDRDNDSLSDMDAKPPVHPVPQMQGAFEESMMETLNESEDAETHDRASTVDSVSRRKMLLEQEEYQRTVAGRWKQKPGEQFHPLWKLVAQISFGMHLLQQGLAKSDEEVIKILQTHVDEIDGFLERTTEDFDLAQGDIDERIRYLKLPLEHGSVFDTMLSERNFRIAIVEGNEKIEHIIDRTAAAMNDSLKDVQKGLDATRELAKYLTRVDKQWDERSEEHDSVYLAMIGNTEGWTRAFLTLQSKGNALRRALVQLGGIVAEMQRRAGAASRKNLVPVRSVQGSRYMVEPRASSPISSMTPPKSPLKPLPNPHASTRSSSQQHSQHSSSRSHSGQHDPKPPVKHATAKPRSSRDIEPSSPRLERAMSAKRVEPILRDTAPEPSKAPKNPEPPMPALSHGASTQEESTPMSSHPQSPASVVTTNPTSPTRRASLRAERAPVVVEAPERMRPNKSTDPIIAARAVEAKPPIPARSASRTKPSLVTFTERARFHLGRKKSACHELGGNDTSSTDLPIQNPSSHDSPHNRPPSPVFQRLSTRRANAISISTYSASASPTSPIKPADSPIFRNESPALKFDSGAPKPSHSSYSSISFLPPHPRLSPLPDYSTPPGEAVPRPDKSLKRSSSVNSGTKSKRASTIDPQAEIRRSSSINTDNRRTPTVKSGPGSERPLSVRHVHLKRSSSINIPSSTPILDDAGGSVNLQHPLLREARHAKFATATEPNSPIHRGDLPLRHYASASNIHSIGFAGRPREIMMPPKRTSSLLYNPPAPISPSAHPALSSSSLADYNRLSPAPAQSSATPAPLRVSSRPDTAASARRDLHTARSSPATARSDSSDDSEGATPPPIGRGVRSTTPSMARLNTNVHPKPQSEAATSPAVKSLLSRKSPTSPSTKSAGATSPTTSPLSAEKPKFKTSATNNIPFYLNPASSTALIDFLASTPPPSSPHPQHKTDPKAFDTQNLYKNYRIDDGKSPVPPGPGGMPMLPLNLAQTSPRVKSIVQPETRDKKKGGWKKMFGGARGEKKSSSPKNPTSMPNQDCVKASKQAQTTKSPVPKKGIREDSGEIAAKQGRHTENGNRNGSGNGNSIFKMRGFNMSRGSMSMSKANAKDRDDEEMSQVESTTSTPVANSNVNGSAVGQSQSFMGVGKDGMWISRKNFLRT
ncbi:MAG: hypothetical protein LQ346_002102 [Caloplaca aetnensis]|nr:MAG: hypothetical protein LQ346_002102 [Caloplaca aetnensis]